MRVEFGFGVGFAGNGTALPPEFVRKASKQILMEASRLFGGCNLVCGQGAWIDETGNLVLEESRTLTVDIVPGGRIGGTEFGIDDEEKIGQLSEYIRSALMQTAVHVTRLVATSRNVYAV